MAVHDLESWVSFADTVGASANMTALNLRNWFAVGTAPLWAAGPWGAGSWAIQPLNIGSEVYRLFPTPPSIVGIGFRWKSSENPSSNPFLQFVKAGSYFFALDTQGTGGTAGAGRLRYNLGSGMIDTTVVVADGAWHYIEATVDVVNKKIWLSVDGVAILTNATMTYGSVTSCDRIYFLDQGTSGVLGSFADIYFTTGQTTLLGPQRVEGFLPNADGSHSDFVPSGGGSHFSKVDEAPHNGVTDYVRSDTVNARDSFDHAAMAGTGTVKAVVVSAVVDKDSNPARSIAATIDDGVGTPVVLTTLGVGSFSPKLAQVVAETNPAGGAWTIAAVNAAEPGVKVTA